MNEITQYFTALSEELEAGRSVESVTVTESLGSAPRGAGARMLVGREGRICGTVGGGPIEYLAEQEAGAFLQNRRSVSRRYDLSDRSSEVGMICGGTITVAFHYIGAGREDIKKVCRAALDAMRAPGALWMVLELPPLLLGEAEPGSHTDEENGGTGPSGNSGGTLNDTDCSSQAGPIWLCSHERVSEPLLHAGTAASQAELLKIGSRNFYLEPIASDSLVHIFGGGHVARELVPLLAGTGFSCAVYDDREEYLKPEDFPDAFATAAVSFEHLAGCLFPAKDNYFVIMTRGHQFDFQAQAFAMSRPAVYIGVMGSRKKKAILTEKLLEMGFTREELERIHAPIGLDIGARTPAEIAVSIASELIRVRNKSEALPKDLQNIAHEQ